MDKKEMTPAEKLFTEEFNEELLNAAKLTGEQLLNRIDDCRMMIIMSKAKLQACERVQSQRKKG